MWDRTLIESKGFGRASKRWWTVPIAAGLHVALIVVAILASYWHVEAIEAPVDKLIYHNPIPLVIGPPPIRGGGPTKPEKPVRVEKTPELTQPIVILPLAQTPISADEFAVECETCADPTVPPGPGTKDGVDGGDRNATGPYSAAGTTNDEPPREIVVGMKEPVLLNRVEPEYPRLALHTRIQGTVVLEAVITKTGSVEQVKTLRADHVVLERAAIDAVLQWKYQPATLNNRPVKVYFTVTVIFHLK